MTTTANTDVTITREIRGNVFLIGLNRPDKKNAFNLKMLRELSAAVGEYEENPDLRAAVIFAHGDSFTAGLDLMDVAPAMGKGGILPEGAYDPVGIHGKRCSKPIICAVQGLCLTLGIELMLAADIVVIGENARLAQIEIKRGIFPFGGANQRWVAASGWGNAMRYLLTGDELDAATAYRIGMAQELVPVDQVLARALEIAETVAAQAPLGVAATIRNARLALEQGAEAATAELVPEIQRLMKTEDAREGVMSFMQRRPAVFKGR
ncbi:crotonase/enoyl-CoA hydratase family protein [Pseudomonas sp. C11]|uniref:crotonase/enoyl-CoA hydratase family protein n=1 Tax=Pseudomonas sp. C11 TaxID=3075550 RepID=UPI002AFEE685|nr:crotonase/enoyl-CoA hydratase family protein [Pseudomonas sp. C11]